MKAVDALAEKGGIRRACSAMGVPRASYYRRRAPATIKTMARPTPPRALQPAERQEVLTILNSPCFADKAPHEVFASLLDDEKYLCSVRTMYRILASARQVRERRNQLRHPNYKKPELLANGPNEVWSWDITKLLGPAKWTYYYLYIIMDIYSRQVVGWMLAHRESAALAHRLIQTTIENEGVNRDRLTLHADRGPSMRSKQVAHLLADLGVTKSHSRPYTSNDNPYSEAQIKTLKYRPGFPDRFGSFEHARSTARALFHWYNHEHYHTGIGLLRPADVHAGRAPAIIQRRSDVLMAAYRKNPERFVRQPPKPPALPPAAWINPPARIEPEDRTQLELQ